MTWVPLHPLLLPPPPRLSRWAPGLKHSAPPDFRRPSLLGLANSSRSPLLVPLRETHSVLRSRPQRFSWSQPSLAPGVALLVPPGGSLREDRTRFFCVQVTIHPWFLSRFTRGENVARAAGYVEAPYLTRIWSP